MLEFDSLASLVANWVRPLVFAVEKAPPKVPRLKVSACAPEPKSGLSVATALPAAVTVMFGSVEVMVLSTPFAKVTVPGPKLAGVASGVLTVMLQVSEIGRAACGGVVCQYV